MIVGVCKLGLFLPENHSLKEKRRLLQAIREKTSRKFGVPVSEVGHQDLWQRAEIGFSLVGSDRRLIGSLLEQMADFIERLDLGQVTERAAEVIDF